MSTSTTPAAPNADRPKWVAVVVGALVVVAVVALFALLRGAGDEPTSASPPGGASGATATQRPRPVAATPERLLELSKSSKRPIYWIGPAGGRTYELTQTPDGSTYVRYLEAGVAVGDPRPNFLTVGTYPQADAFRTVSQASERDGAQVEKLEEGGLAVANRSRPNSWYIAYPDAKELIEVFSPRAARARELVRAQRVVPVDS